jgi:hypothetical protein
VCDGFLVPILVGVKGFVGNFVFDCFLMPVNSFFWIIFGQVFSLISFLLESLILAQDERWRRA